MGGIKIFRLQEWKVRATACTQSLNLAVAAVVFSPVIDSTLDNRCNKADVNIWSHYQHSYTSEENKWELRYSTKQESLIFVSSTAYN
jgi:hypothetical protein